MGLVTIRNVTRGTIVAARAEVAASPVGRLLRLMGRRGWREADGLLIRPRTSIHTYFVRTRIDVVFVSRDGVVPDLAPARGPWRLGPIVFRAGCVVELPVGAIDRSGTRLDDRLVVQPRSDNS